MEAIEVTPAAAAQGTPNPVPSKQVDPESPLALNVSEQQPSMPMFDDMSALEVGFILFSLGLATFLYAIEQTIVATAVATIGAAVGATGSLTWITTSYLLTTTAFQPIMGRLAEFVGTRRLLIIEIWIFIAGCIIAGASNSLTLLVAGRMISGVGGAGLLSLSCILISQMTHERQRGSYFNLINVVFTLSDSVGPVIGGAFAQSGNWRWIFYFNAFCGPIITAILLKALRSGSGGNRKPTTSSVKAGLMKLDIIGMTLLVAALTFLVVALNIAGGQSASWSSPSIIGLFVAAGVSFIIFIVAENYASAPVLPVGLFVRWDYRNVPIMTVVRTLLFFHLFTTTFYLPAFLQVIGVSTITSAALVIPFLVMSAVASTITNFVAGKYNHVRPLFMAALAILPVGMGLMSTLDQSSSLGKIIGYSLICGVGFGSGTQISMVIAQVGLPSDALNTMTAFISSAPNLGGVLGIGIIGTIINTGFRSNLASKVPSSTLSLFNLNEPVDLIHKHTGDGGLDRDVVIDAYVQAWQKGFLILAGIAVFQFVLCLILRPVELDDGTKKASAESEIVEGEGEKPDGTSVVVGEKN